MLKRFYPTAYADSVFDIDYEKLYQSGVRGLLIDIDNTLVYHDEDVTPEVEQLFEHIQKTGLKIAVISNNTELRVRSFLRNMQLPYIYNAGKPGIGGFLKAVELIQVDRSQAVVIGDQMFADILGANRCGMDSIMVRYMRPQDEIKGGIWMLIEDMILACFRRSRSCGNKFAELV